MTRDHFADRDYVGFPPGSHLLMLPRASARAARAGLALYEAVEPAQRFALGAARLLSAVGLHSVLPDSCSPTLEWGWWQRWIEEVAEPAVGPVGHVAVRIPATSRVCLLLMDEDGKPVGFAKIMDNAESQLSADASRLLGESRMSAFRVPRVIVDGVFESVQFTLSEALPEGPHRRPPFDPIRVRRILDEFTSRLSGLTRPRGVPAEYVVCHTGFTPRNLRVAGDGSWWLFDFDNVRWGPRLASELRYWTADLAYASRPRVERASRKVLTLLRERGSDAEIREAVHWPGHTRTYRPVERDIHLRVAELATE